MSIRFKVIIPYVILTLVVAVIGVYVITQLVSVRQEERLRNQLREAGRIVSDEFSKQEKQNIEKARLIAYTANLAESLRAGDRAALERLVVPQAEGNRLEQLFLIDEQGREQLHLFRNPDGVLETVNYETGLGNSPWISALLLGNSESASRVFGQNQIGRASCRERV